jgi:hypothetical protein
MKKNSVGAMRHRVQLVFEEVLEKENGEFEKKIILGDTYWARVKALALPDKNEMNSWFWSDKKDIKNAFEVIMRKIYISNALHSDLVGLLFRGKVMKITKSLVPSEDEQWMRAIIVDYGVNNG